MGECFSALWASLNRKTLTSPVAILCTFAANVGYLIIMMKLVKIHEILTERQHPAETYDHIMVAMVSDVGSKS